MIPQNRGKVKPNPPEVSFLRQNPEQNARTKRNKNILLRMAVCSSEKPKKVCAFPKTLKIQTILYKTKGAKEKNGAVRTNEQAPCSFVTFVRCGFFFFRFYDNGKTARRKHEFS